MSSDIDTPAPTDRADALARLMEARDALGDKKNNRWYSRAVLSKEEEPRFFVIAVPPDHDCWQPSLNAYANVGCWDHRGLTTKEFADYIALAHNLLPAVAEQFAAKDREIKRLKLELQFAKESRRPV